MQALYLPLLTAVAGTEEDSTAMGMNHYMLNLAIKTLSH